VTALLVTGGAGFIGANLVRRITLATGAVNTVAGTYTAPGTNGKFVDGVGISAFFYGPLQLAMEDAAGEQAARVSRRIEYLSVISTLAPMLGLMGTVWGMIVAFMEFELKANPQISELAPGIYKALVTTLQGLGVAIPCIGGLAFFRSRIEDLATESTLLAAHVFADYRRTLQAKRPPVSKDIASTR
jgi:biopolymer transport protein ExbB